MSSTVIQQIRERAAAHKGRIILSEGNELRAIQAARKLLDDGICEVTLVGAPAEIEKVAKEGGVSVSGITMVDPSEHPMREQFAAELYEKRKAKGLTQEQAEELSRRQIYCAAMMVSHGEGTGTVGGAVHATAEIVRAGLWCIGMAKDVSVVSGAFLMVVPDFLGTGKDKTLYYADSGVVPDPNSDQLASIAIASAATFRALTGEEPRIAMLSFSTKGSATHPDVDKVIVATKKVQELRPDLLIDGELQADAALVPGVAKAKAPGSSVAGTANVLIFPDLGAGNIGYKLTQRLAHATALGPILQGLAKPAHDLSRGCSAEDIVDMAAIAICMAE
ncbi:MAG TPA: phosphate acetyltransferase [Candidatus Latescibacteria bacterium]|mgnify:FL=1|nr:phosphate acetyltransferase [Candidatus Latescibacterota bacterium]